MKMIFRKWRKNAVLRFLLTYFVMMLLALSACLAGFQRSFRIVEKSSIEEKQRLLQQGAIECDGMLSDLYLVGMQLALSDSLQSLGQYDTARGTGYYTVIKKMLSEYGSFVRYYDTTLDSNTFLYVNGIDRVLYAGAVYPRSVFQTYPDKWNVSEEEWMEICRDGNNSPHFAASGGGQIFYVFPCMQAAKNGVRLGTLFFRIGSEDFLKYLGFLQSYSDTSFFLYDGDELLLRQDSLSCRDTLREEWIATPGTYVSNGQIVLNRRAESGLTYLVVLSEQEAMLVLENLRTYLWSVVLIATAAGIALAVFFSMRSGTPINTIASTLQQENETAYSTDLNTISHSVQQLIREQKQDRPALQKTFFHNLLKGDFISQTELEYMAARAAIPLTGTSCCAAALRLFPRIDTEHIDGATVETARALQDVIEARLRETYSGAFWTYKRNTLVTLYVFPSQECGEVLPQALESLVEWLQDTYRVEGCWGMGESCTNLLQFWKSSEQAISMLENEDVTAPLRVYSTAAVPADSYYLPYSVEEHFVQGLRSGNFAEAENAIGLIRIENLVRRKLNRRSFRKLNRRLCDILSGQGLPPETEQQLAQLSELAQRDDAGEAYFACLERLCSEGCDALTQKKRQQCSDRAVDLVAFIEKNYTNPDLCLGLVSRQFGLSEGYLSLLFKSEMQVNFADYLEQIRIRAACERIRNGEKIADVAENTGYNSVQSFRRAFKRVIGVSPREYRA